MDEGTKATSDEKRTTKGTEANMLVMVERGCSREGWYAGTKEKAKRKRARKREREEEKEEEVEEQRKRRLFSL